MDEVAPTELQVQAPPRNYMSPVCFLPESCDILMTTILEDRPDHERELTRCGTDGRCEMPEMPKGRPGRLGHPGDEMP